MSEKILKPVEKEYSAEVVAECLVGIASRKSSLGIDEGQNPIKEGVTNLKLQKLLFFAQAAHLALFDGKPLFNDEFEAWGLGPVIPAVYRKYKGSPSDPIVVDNLNCEDGELVRFLENIWKIFGKYSASELVNMSHAQGTPWQMVYKSGERGIKIPKELIQNYYKKLFKIDGSG